MNLREFIKSRYETIIIFIVLTVFSFWLARTRLVEGSSIMHYFYPLGASVFLILLWPAVMTYALYLAQFCPPDFFDVGCSNAPLIQAFFAAGITELVYLYIVSWGIVRIIRRFKPRPVSAANK